MGDARGHPDLQPFDPPSYTAEQAAHLLGRAGFGGTPQEILAAQAMGPKAAAERLLSFPDATAAQQHQTDAGQEPLPDLSLAAPHSSQFDRLAARFAGVGEREARILRGQMIDAHRAAVLNVMAWWLKRMAYGRHPLQEKLTFFWHGHFTTSSYDIWSAPLLWQQNELLRRHAAGPFAGILSAVCRDPAMLQYLDNATSHRDAPNENFARELLELYTLGIGHYSEDDVRAIARAFTGWSHDGEQFVFREADHDFGDKTLFGKTRRFDGQNVVDLILQQPACPRFIATKLFQFFVRPTVDDALAAALGELFRELEMDVRALLRVLLTSRAFYDPAGMGSRIKSPVQLMVGTIRLLGLAMPDIKPLKEHLAAMGQVPFLPPDVKGWPSDRAWITTSTLFSRQNAAAWLAGMLGDAPDERPWPQQVDAWAARLLVRPLGDEPRQILIELGQHERVSTARLVQLMVALPEYQLH